MIKEYQTIAKNINKLLDNYFFFGTLYIVQKLKACIQAIGEGQNGQRHEAGKRTAGFYAIVQNVYSKIPIFEA